MYICSDLNMDYYNASVLMYEFGHAAHRLLNATDSYNQDLREIHSQGLGMLLALRSDILFGEEGDMYIRNVLMDSAYVVLIAYMVDDFEKQMYYGYVTTAEGIADLRTQREAEYFQGFIVAEWYYISHIFTSSVYYISYGVLTFSALEIFLQSLEDYDAAVDLYLDIVVYTDDEVITMTDEFGMMSFFREEDVMAIFEIVL